MEAEPLPARTGRTAFPSTNPDPFHVHSHHDIAHSFCQLPFAHPFKSSHPPPTFPGRFFSIYLSPLDSNDRTAFFNQQLLHHHRRHHHSTSWHHNQKQKESKSQTKQNQIQKEKQRHTGVVERRSNTHPRNHSTHSSVDTRLLVERNGEIFKMDFEMSPKSSLFQRNNVGNMGTYQA